MGAHLRILTGSQRISLLAELRERRNDNTKNKLIVEAAVPKIPDAGAKGPPRNSLIAVTGPVYLATCPKQYLDMHRQLRETSEQNSLIHPLSLSRSLSLIKTRPSE